MIGSGLKLLICTCAAIFLNACAATGDPQPARSAEETAFRLVVTDLVSAMVQVRELQPTTTTLQMSQPDSMFGTLLKTALEDAGYGIQVVEGDQGSHYVSYAVRKSETDAGLVNDYVIRVNDLEIRREYQRTASGIFPSSVLFVSGSEAGGDIKLSEKIFTEQGGDEYFISGVESEASGQFGTDIREIVSDENSRVVAERRTKQQRIIAISREYSAEVERKFEERDFSTMDQLKRLVVLFPDNKTLRIGLGNKYAISEMLEDYNNSDLFEIKACDDIDGRNEMSEKRAIRIKEEFMSLGVPGKRIFRAPCTRSNFRHESDDSPTPVAIFQYRKPA